MIYMNVFTKDSRKSDLVPGWRGSLEDGTRPVARLGRTALYNALRAPPREAQSADHEGN